MTVFDLDRYVVREYERFARSFTEIQARDINDWIGAAYNGNRFWPEPMIQLNPRFRGGGTVGELVRSGGLAAGMERIFRDAVGRPGAADASLKLHKHQLDAITLASQGKSFVVTTGTGSGKSLCYFIPIIDRVLRSKAAGEPQRTRAVVIYPMNALANSQLEELDKSIKDTAFAGQVTYKRYTGQDDDEAKERVKESAPDILLTNFMMLELLLTRQSERDQQVIRNCEGLEFLVLDELHTYRGRQGADVAMLVRRVRERLGDPARPLQCIGTSATMSSDEDVRRGQNQVADVASRLFATPIEASSVITEELVRSTKDELVPSRMAPELLRAAVLEFDERNASDASLHDNPFMAWTEMTLGLESADGGARLRRARPIDLSTAAEKLSVATGLEAQEARKRIEQALEIAGRGGKARGEEHDRPFFPVRLHRFISGAGRVYATLEPIGKREMSFEGQIELPGREATARLYATYFCRHCGQEHHPVTLVTGGGDRTFIARSIDESPSDEPQEGADGRKEEQGFLTPVTGEAIAKFEGKPQEYPDEWLEERRGELRLKPAYRDSQLTRHIVAPDGKVGVSGQSAWFQRGRFRFCACCREPSAQSGRDINRLAGLSAEGRSSATTVLVSSVLRWMKQPEHGRDDKRQKVLGFSDNRQDAALQAGHFNDFVFISLFRGATLAALQSTSTDGLSDSTVGRALAEKLGFTAGNKQRLPEWLGDRDVEQGQPLADAASDLAAVLGHRFWFDQRRGWRYTFPNLEQLGLIKAHYKGLAEFCQRDAELTESLTVLRPLSPQEREEAFRAILDAARQGLAVRSDALNRAKLDELHKRRQRLSPPWGFDEDETPREAGLLVVGQVPTAATFQEDRSFIRSGVQSALGRKLRRIIRKQLDKEAQKKLLLAMCAALKRLGLLVDVPIKDASAYRISAENVSFHAAPAKDGSNRYFVDLYTTLAEALCNGGQLLFGDEAREHTAQVEQKRRQFREKRFRWGDKERAELEEKRSELRQLGEPERFLPVMFCSPTMELGVDISELDAVYMRNVPPTPANYAQRSGRAGRGGAAALVLTYCSAQSPHDQYYFARRREMIQGIVRPPAIDLANQDLVSSHLNAVWLAESEQPLSSTIADVLDTSQPTRPLRSDLEAAFASPELQERANARMASLLKGLAEDLGAECPDWLVDTGAYAAEVAAKAPTVFRHAFSRWRDLLGSAEAQRNEARRILDNLGIRDSKVRNSARALQEMADRQINLLLAGSEAIGSDFYTYRYLATEGFLPGYNFPRLPLMAFIPGQGSDKRQAYVQRPRFLGISEFGPHSRIYHEGRAYRVVRVQVPASELKEGGEKLATETVHLCRACGARDHREPERCHACESDEGFRQIHDVKRIENLSTRPAEHITANDEERQRQGFEIITTFAWSRRAGRWDIQSCDIQSADGEAIATARYAAAATLQRLNLGLRRRKKKDELGFLIEPGTGRWRKPENGDDVSGADDDDPARGRTQRIVPMVEDHKNTLLLRPVHPFSSLVSAAVVQHALLRGLETEFQLEEGELLSEPMPGRDDRRAILFYEATEGGAGVLARIAREPDALARVAQQALGLMHYEWPNGEGPAPDRIADRGSETCKKGCYRCLLTYFNQPEHERIDRHDPEALDFLCRLATATVVSRTAPPPVEPAAAVADPLPRFVARLEAAHLPPATKVKTSGKGWQLTWGDHLTVALLGPTVADRSTLEDMDYRVVEVPLDEGRWAAALESLKSMLEAT